MYQHFLQQCYSNHPLYQPLIPCWQYINKLSSLEKSSSISILNALLNVKQLAGRRNIFDNSLLVSIDGNNFKFVDATKANDKSKKIEKYYECKIYEDGVIPTRDFNIHDFFNGLCWLTFPQTKKMITTLHISEINKSSNPSQRGRHRDMLTLFDEGGMIVAIDNDCQIDFENLLRQHRWQEAFCVYREEMIKSVRFIIIGHALFEKSLNPYLSMTARAIFCRIPFAQFCSDNSNDLLQQQSDYQTLIQTCDLLVSKYLMENSSLASPSLLSAIPIFAYPNWAIENNNFDFYLNENIFRPLKTNLQS